MRTRGSVNLRRRGFKACSSLSTNNRVSKNQPSKFVTVPKSLSNQTLCLQQTRHIAEGNVMAWLTLSEFSRRKRAPSVLGEPCALTSGWAGVHVEPVDLGGRAFGGLRAHRPAPPAGRHATGCSTTDWGTTQGTESASTGQRQGRGLGSHRLNRAQQSNKPIRVRRGGAQKYSRGHHSITDLVASDEALSTGHRQTGTDSQHLICTQAARQLVL